MLFQRQKCLLALLDSHGGELGNLDFQKLLFLFCQEAKALYEFVPYKFGGFSFSSYADKRKLTRLGLLGDEEEFWQITSAGKAAIDLPKETQTAISRFADRYAGLRGDLLVAEAYRKYPYHASRSEIAQRLLKNDALALLAIEAARPHACHSGLCTIGYEGHSLEGFLNRLLLDGVTLLCDVRRNPFSRKYGFSKCTLSNSCAAVGIRYEHLPELGISSDDRRDLQTQDDYDALFSVYEEKTLPFQGRALEKIGDWVRSGHRVALTCYESSPEQCHRHCVAEAWERDAGARVSRHL